MKYFPKASDGFTAVELLVTIIVAAMFTITLYQLMISVNNTSAAARNRATASDIAYGNLRKYASAGSAWKDFFTCSTASGSSNTNDLSVNSNAAGTTLMSGSLTSSSADLPGPVTYSVKALGIFGCNGLNANAPIRIESTVTYGPKNTVIKHATLVSYQ